MKVWVMRALNILAAVAMLAVVGITCFFSGYDQGYSQGYSTGHNDGYDTGYSQGYTVGQGEGWEEGYNIGWNEGYQEPLRLFESIGELRTWILQDDTDSLTYVPDTFDCDDFAMRLSQNAANDRYFIGLYYDKWAGHMKNFARIEGKTDVIYLIEPQNDMIGTLRVD